MTNGNAAENKPEMNAKGEPAPADRRLLYWAASLSIMVLVAHAIDAPDHLKEWWVYASIFIIAGSAHFFTVLLCFSSPGVTMKAAGYVKTQNVTPGLIIY